MKPAMNRRKFGRAIRAAVALTVATGVAGCATIQSAVNSLGGAAGTAAVEQVIADIQGELTAGQLVLAAGAQWLSATAVSTVNKAIEGAQAAAAALGAAVANAATGTTVQTIEGFISDIVQALVAGLSGGAPVWLTAAVAAVVAWFPVTDLASWDVEWRDAPYPPEGSFAWQGAQRRGWPPAPRAGARAAARPRK